MFFDPEYSCPDSYSLHDEFFKSLNKDDDERIRAAQSSHTLVMQYILMEDNEAVDKNIAKGYDINSCYTKHGIKYSALDFAIAQFEEHNYSLLTGWDDKIGPLYEGLCMHDLIVPLVKKLLDHGINPDGGNEDGSMFAHLYYLTYVKDDEIDKRKVKVLKMLIEYGCDPNLYTTNRVGIETSILDDILIECAHCKSLGQPYSVEDSGILFLISAGARISKTIDCYTIEKLSKNVVDHLIASQDEILIKQSIGVRSVGYRRFDLPSTDNLFFQPYFSAI